MTLSDIATYLIENDFNDYEFVYSESSDLDITLRLEIRRGTKQILVTTHTDFISNI